jgi:hypothetical protein
MFSETTFLNNSCALYNHVKHYQNSVFVRDGNARFQHNNLVSISTIQLANLAQIHNNLASGSPTNRKAGGRGLRRPPLSPANKIPQEVQREIWRSYE